MINHFLGLAYRFLFRKKARTFFSIMGISFAFFLLTSNQIFITSLETSVEQSIREKYGDFDLKLQKEKKKELLSPAEIKKIASLQGIKKVRTTYQPYQGDELNQKELLGLPIYYGLHPDVLQFDKIKMKEGHFPKQNEVALEETYLKKKGWKVGQTIHLPFPPHGTKPVVISASLKKMEGLSRFAFFQLEWLQEATDKKGQATRVFLTLKDAEQKEQIIKQIEIDFPKLYIDKRVEMDKEKENIAGLRPIVYGLTVAGLIAGIFLVISTLQMSVRERQQQLSTLRLIGAKKNQLMWLVFLEAGLICLVAVILGTSMGWVSSLFIPALAEAWLGIKITRLMVPWDQISLFSGCGFLFLLVASLLPGWLAGQSSPMAAFRQERVVEKHPLLVKWRIILFIGAISFSTMSILLSLDRLYIALAGVAITFAVMGLIPALLKWIIQVIHLVWKPVFQIESWLSGRNTLRHIQRSQLIITVLMLTIIVGCVGSMLFTSVVQQAERDLLQEQPIRFHVKALDGEKGFNPQLSHEIEQLPGTKTAATSTSLHVVTANLKGIYKPFHSVVHVKGKKQAWIGIQGIHYEEAQRLFSFPKDLILQKQIKQGEILLTKEVSETFGYQTGDVVQLMRFESKDLSNPKIYSFKVAKILEKDPIYGKDNFVVYMDQRYMEKTFKHRNLQSIYIQADDVAREEQIKQQIESMLQDPRYQEATLYDRNEKLADLKKQAEQRYFLFGVAIVMMSGITLLGLINSFGSSFQERKREFATLGAIGSTPKQILKLALLEGMMLTTAGGLLGIGSAIVLGYHLLLALKATTILFPTYWVIGTLLLSPMLGILAVTLSAKQLAQQNISRTLQVE